MRLGGRLGGEGNVGVNAKRWNHRPGQVCAIYVLRACMPSPPKYEIMRIVSAALARVA